MQTSDNEKKQDRQDIGGAGSHRNNWILMTIIWHQVSFGSVGGRTSKSWLQRIVRRVVHFPAAMFVVLAVIFAVVFIHEYLVPLVCNVASLSRFALGYRFQIGISMQRYCSMPRIGWRQNMSKTAATGRSRCIYDSLKDDSCAFLFSIDQFFGENSKRPSQLCQIYPNLQLPRPRSRHSPMLRRNWSGIRSQGMRPILARCEEVQQVGCQIMCLWTLGYAWGFPQPWNSPGTAGRKTCNAKEWQYLRDDTSTFWILLASGFLATGQVLFILDSHFGLGKCTKL